ncbi:COG4705 family protein [Aquirhabdus parva]
MVEHNKISLTVSKLPEITLLFWVMKISTTTLGETAGDLFSMTLNLGYAISSILLFGFFLVTVIPQLFAKRYLPLLYWSVILSTTMVGTTISDYLDRSLHLGYVAGSGLLLSILLLIFAFWRLSGQTLDVEKIRSPKTELIYWMAILVSNTLGTALGDFLADSSGLGYAGGALLIGGILLASAIAARFTQISKVFLFWLAFILTRPFGATFGDLFTKSVDKGGLGVGTIESSLILLSILGLCITYAMWQYQRRVR